MRRELLLSIVMAMGSFLYAKAQTKQYNVKYPIGLDDIDLVTASFFDSVYHKLPDQSEVRFTFHQELETYLSVKEQQKIQKSRAEKAQQYFQQYLCKDEFVDIKYTTRPELIVFKPYGLTKGVGKLNLNKIEKQTVVINGNIPDVIYTKDRVRVRIPQNALETEDYTIADLSEVHLTIYELNSIQSIVNSQMNTYSKLNGQLSSLSMFRIEATDRNGKKLRLMKNRAIEFYLPVKQGEFPQDYYTFEGRFLNDQVVWTKTQEQCVIQASSAGLTETRSKNRSSLLLKVKSYSLGWINCAKSWRPVKTETVKLIIPSSDSSLYVSVYDMDNNQVLTATKKTNDPHAYYIHGVTDSQRILVMVYSKKDRLRTAFTQGSPKSLDGASVYLKDSSEKEWENILFEHLN